VQLILGRRAQQIPGPAAQSVTGQQPADPVTQSGVVINKVPAGAGHLAQPPGVVIGNPERVVVQQAARKCFRKSLRVQSVALGRPHALKEPVRPERIDHHYVEAAGYQLAGDEKRLAATGFKRDARVLSGHRHQIPAQLIGRYGIRLLAELTADIVADGHGRVAVMNIQPDTDHLGLLLSRRE